MTGLPKPPKSHLEERLANQIRFHGLPEAVREFPFAKSIGRRWRSDFAWPDAMLLVEIEGGSWIDGGHVRGSGFAKDCEKYNHAAILGFKVLRFTGDQVMKDQAIPLIREALRQKMR